MTFYETLFITSLVSIVGFVAWRVYIIETNHLSHIQNAITEMKTDIKWLVSFHQDQKKSRTKKTSSKK